MSDDDSADPRVGTVVAERYRLLERLDSGAMGVVYRGERLGLARAVAVKFLHPMFSKYPEFMKRFSREAHAMSRLDHPNCVSVIDYGTADAPFIVMDYVSGPTLKDAIAEGPFEVDRALDICRQILAGLAHAHEQDIIHRDIKPANVVLSTHEGTGDRARILDFGLAKLRDADASASMVAVGTPNYMSPEQASGATVDARADLYSTGVVLFEMLTGTKPFTADEPYAVLVKHKEQPPPTLRERLDSPAFTPALEALVARALAKNPDDRFQTPAELAAALDALDDPDEPDEPAPPARRVAAAAVPPVARVRPTPLPRRRSYTGAILVVLLLAAAGGAFALGLPQRWIAQWQDKRDNADEAPVASDVKSIEDAKEIAAGGHRDVAIQGLHELRRTHPDDAAISFELGAMYVAKSWYVEAVASYREAIEKDSGYATNAAVIRDAVTALGHDNAYDEARALILNHIEDAATAELQAARSRGDGPLSQRADALLGELAH